MNEAVRNAAQPILEIENLSISFFTRRGEIPAVMDFSCSVLPGEAMGIVGESGCGKSTVSLGIMRDLSNIGKIVGGSIKFKGKDMGELSPEELRSIRGNEIAMIYQEPMASLNPAMKVGQQLMEVPILHDKVSKEEAYKRALETVRAVRLPDPERMMRSYPHQLSGGQQQRIVIAMALLSKPALLLLDEPTTALDVTVEAGIVELVKGLGKQFGTSMIFVSHNLGLILETCDRITVMYSGEAVETGKIKDVFDRMRHPYTQGLFRSIPLPGADKNSRPLISIPGQLPLPHERPKGCNFGPRCHHFVEGLCNAAEIPMIPVEGHDGHFSRCVRFNEIDWSALPPNGAQGDEGAGQARRADAARSTTSGNTTRSRPTRSSAAAKAASSRPTRRSASWRANPRRWRSSANPAAASRRWPRCCSGWRRRAPARHARQQGDPVDRHRDARRRRRCRRSRWCSRTRSTR